MAANFDPPARSCIEDSDLDSDPDRLHTELRTVSMFGGARVVRTGTSPTQRAVPKLLLEPGAITGARRGGRWTAGRDALRKLFEGSSVAAAVPCYADEARDIEQSCGRRWRRLMCR